LAGLKVVITQAYEQGNQDIMKAEAWTVLL
jgi:hypothetical protein